MYNKVYDEFYEFYDITTDSTFDFDAVLTSAADVEIYEKQKAIYMEGLRNFACKVEAMHNFNLDILILGSAVPLLSANCDGVTGWGGRHSAEVRICVVDNELLAPFFLIMKSSEFYKFDYLVDLYGFDNFGGENYRFVVVYKIRNLETFVDTLVVTFIQEGWMLPSLQDIFKAAIWSEREAWELVGIYFSGHRGLRRLLSDYNFKGHPLRKDFPVTGYLECFYSYNLNAIEFVKVEFMQEYRVYEFYENWETTSPFFITIAARFKKLKAVLGFL